MSIWSKLSDGCYHDGDGTVHSFGWAPNDRVANAARLTRAIAAFVAVIGLTPAVVIAYYTTKVGEETVNFAVSKTVIDAEAL